LRETTRAACLPGRCPASSRCAPDTSRGLASTPASPPVLTFFLKFPSDRPRFHPTAALTHRTRSDPRRAGRRRRRRTKQRHRRIQVRNPTSTRRTRRKPVGKSKSASSARCQNSSIRPVLTPSFASHPTTQDDAHGPRGRAGRGFLPRAAAPGHASGRRRRERRGRDSCAGADSCASRVIGSGPTAEARQRDGPGPRRPAARAHRPERCRADGAGARVLRRIRRRGRRGRIKRRG